MVIKAFMKKTLLAVLCLCFLTTGTSQAANYYFDLASGNDTTGDGSAGSPWKTIDKCTTSRSPGDECRGALTTVTTLSGTCTFTNGSTTVATSADLSAVVAAGDVIGKNTGVEGWWTVASRDTTTITLVNQFWAPTGSGDAATGYKITPVAASEKYDVGSSGDASSYLKISGGWNLSNTTQEGITAVTGYSTGATIAFSGDNYVELSKFVLVGTTGAAGIAATTSNGLYFHDLWIAQVASATVGGITIAQSSGHIFDNIYITVQGNDGISLTNVSFAKMTDVYIYSSGNASQESGLDISSNNCVFDNVRIYNSYDDNLLIATEGSLNVFKNCVFDTNRYAGSFGINIGTSMNRFYNCTVANATSTDINILSGEAENYFIGCTLSSTSGDYTRSITADSCMDRQLIIAPAAADSTIIYNAGIITMDSSAAARSGKAMKYTVTDIDGICAKVGSVKVVSEAADVTISAYIKDDATFDGTVVFTVLQNGQWLAMETKAPTTSYAKNSVVIPLASLNEGEYIDLYVSVFGTAGNLWVDDFLVEQ